MKHFYRLITLLFISLIITACSSSSGEIETTEVIRNPDGSTTTVTVYDPNPPSPPQKLKTYCPIDLTMLRRICGISSEEVIIVNSDEAFPGVCSFEIQNEFMSFLDASIGAHLNGASVESRRSLSAEAKIVPGISSVSPENTIFIKAGARYYKLERFPNDPSAYCDIDEMKTLAQEAIIPNMEKIFEMVE